MNVRIRLYFPILLIFLLFVWVSYSVTVHTNSTPANSYLQIEVVPDGTAVRIDGHGVRNGKTSVSVGSHSITAEKQGFSSKSRTVSTKAGQTVYVGIALQPDTPNTSNWYATHPGDQQQAEGIGSHEADYENQLANQSNAFLGQLPLSYGDGQGGLVTIAQGVPLRAGGPPAIYITASTASTRQGVLTYIRNQGYDPADMDIVFYSQSNPLDSAGD
jgi:hypothetical protein